MGKAMKHIKTAMSSNHIICSLGLLWKSSQVFQQSIANIFFIILKKNTISRFSPWRTRTEMSSTKFLSLLMSRTIFYWILPECFRKKRNYFTTKFISNLFLLISVTQKRFNFQTQFPPPFHFIYVLWKSSSTSIPVRSVLATICMVFSSIFETAHNVAADAASLNSNKIPSACYRNELLLFYVIAVWEQPPSPYPHLPVPQAPLAGTLSPGIYPIIPLIFIYLKLPLRALCHKITDLAKRHAWFAYGVDSLN